MFFEYFKAICTEQGTTPTAVVRKLGLSSGKVTAWKNGSIPKNETLCRLADFLNVPVYAFFGGSEKNIKDRPALSEDVLELIDIYKSLSKPDQRRLFGKAYELLDAQGQQNPGEKIAPPDISVVTAVHNSGINTKK